MILQHDGYSVTKNVSQGGSLVFLYNILSSLGSLKSYKNGSIFVALYGIIFVVVDNFIAFFNLLNDLLLFLEEIWFLSCNVPLGSVCIIVCHSIRNSQ